MTKAQHQAYRFRRTLLVAAILCWVLGLAWYVLPLFNEWFGDRIDFLGAGTTGTPLGAPLLWDSAWGYVGNLLLLLSLLLLGQWAFLRPGAGWLGRLMAQGRPMRSAVITAAAMAMLLTTGAIALLLELPDWWSKLIGTDWWPSQAAAWGAIWAGMLLLWGLWAWVFYVYWRQGDRYTQLGRMIRGLIAGSVVETLVTIPVHIWATHQRSCYCERGSYTTLVLSGTVLLWAFGPGIVLLYLREKYRRQRVMPFCGQCGYNLTGNLSGICPECGEATGLDPAE